MTSDSAGSPTPVGLYVHIPFCDGKCPYCDFYSVAPDDEVRRRYTDALCREIERYPSLAADTVYFGGGTPTLFGDEHLSRILSHLSEHYHLSPDAETTLEMNPRTADLPMLSRLRRSGFNRISIGVQSCIDPELRALGRRHTFADARQAVAYARQAGFENTSLDLMLGIPGQTADSLRRSIDLLCSLEPEHISAYILKIEPNTPFARMDLRSCLPDDDTQAELYELASALLRERGYRQYEISNFARPGFESRHNLKYWSCEEYLGFGPSAHSFYKDRRFFYPRDLEGFIASPHTEEDGEGGGGEEYAMLRLRLADGLTYSGWQTRFGSELPQDYITRALPLAQAGLLVVDQTGIRLTPKGFLVSNEIIGRLLG